MVGLELKHGSSLPQDVSPACTCWGSSESCSFSPKSPLSCCLYLEPPLHLCHEHPPPEPWVRGTCSPPMSTAPRFSFAFLPPIKPSGSESSDVLVNWLSERKEGLVCSGGQSPWYKDSLHSCVHMTSL